MAPLTRHRVRASFGSSRWRSPLKIKLALMSLSTALSLWSMEIVLVATRPELPLLTPTTRQGRDEIVEAARRFSVDYDSRSKVQVLSDLRGRGLDPVPDVLPADLLVEQSGGVLRSSITIDDTEVLPLGGMSRRLTVFCNEGGEWITYRSDEHGFHNPTGIWRAGTVDLVAIGDSFAQGACVASDRNFVATIRARYPATLNLGVSSKGPLMSLADLKEYASSVTPGAVLWFFYEENDFMDLTRERRSPLLTRYLDGTFTQRLRHAQPVIDQAFERYVSGRLAQAPGDWPEEYRGVVPRAIRLEHLVHRLRLIADIARGSEPTNYRMGSRDTMDLFARVVATARAAVEAWGGKLYLVYLPERQRYVESRVARFDETNHERVLSLAASLDVAVIDVSSAFHAHGDPLALFPFRRGGHYNEAGHRLVAETVLKALGPRAGWPRS